MKTMLDHPPKKLNPLSYFSQWRETVLKFKETIPTWFFYYLVAYLLITYILFVFYIPGNDFDTMTSYMARIKLEEFGSLEQTATLEIQYLFPKFFDYLHKPLLEWGYFTTLPNFVLFLSLCFLLLRISSPSQFVFLSILIFACQPLLIGNHSLKNDMTLGIFAFWSWYVIFFVNSKTWFLTLSTLTLCLLLGTKIHGVLLVILLLPPLLYRLYRDRLISQLSIFLWFVFSPLFIIVSSASVYLANIKKYDTIMPKLDYLSVGNVSFFKNIYTFIVSSTLATFDLPVYLSDAYLKTNILEWENKLALGVKDAHYGILRPASNINAFGVIIVVVLILNIYVLIKPRFSPALKTAAAIAVVYWLGLLTQFNYSNWVNRYFLPTYILGIFPAAIVLSQLPIKQWLKNSLIVYAVLVSFHTLVLTAETNLISVTVIDLPSRNSYYVESVWSHITDRDSLYFHLWSGYRQIHQYFRDNIALTNSLLFINNATGNDPPFIYPLIKDRQPANTHIFNTRYGGSYDNLLGKYEYLMIYKGTITDPRYQEDFNYNNGEMIIYKLKDSDRLS